MFEHLTKEFILIQIQVTTMNNEHNSSQLININCVALGTGKVLDDFQKLVLQVCFIFLIIPSQFRHLKQNRIKENMGEIFA